LTDFKAVITVRRIIRFFKEMAKITMKYNSLKKKQVAIKHSATWRAVTLTFRFCFLHSTVRNLIFLSAFSFLSVLVFGKSPIKTTEARRLKDVNFRSHINHKYYARRTYIAVSSDSKTLYSGSRDGIKVWDVSNPKNSILLKTINISPKGEPADMVYSLKLSTDNQTLYAASESGIKVLDVSDVQNPIWINSLYAGQPIHIETLFLSNDNKTLFSAEWRPLGNHASVNVLDVSNPKNIPLLKSISPNTTQHAQYTGTNAIALSSNNQTLFSGANGSSIQIFDISNIQKPIVLVTIHPSNIQGAHEYGVASLALSENNNILFSGDNNGAIKIWNVANAKNPILLKSIDKSTTQDLHTRTIMSLTLSPDNKTLFSGSEDHSIKVWDVSDVQDPILITSLDKMTTPNAHATKITSLALSPDNKTLFSAEESGIVNVWDLNYECFTRDIKKNLSRNLESISSCIYLYRAHFLDYLNDSLKKSSVNSNPFLISLHELLIANITSIFIQDIDSQRIQNEILPTFHNELIAWNASMKITTLDDLFEYPSTRSLALDALFAAARGTQGFLSETQDKANVENLIRVVGTAKTKIFDADSKAELAAAFKQASATLETLNLNHRTRSFVQVINVLAENLK